MPHCKHFHSNIYISIMKTYPCNIERFFSALQIENFQLKKFVILIFAQNIDCWSTLEPPRRGGSNKYPQSMFWSKNKKNRYTPAYSSFAILKWGSRGYTLHRHVFVMENFPYSFFGKSFLIIEKPVMTCNIFNFQAFNCTV